ncbi:MAG: TolC family protein [Saprospiraceae bacterium]|nr:TolC family protein [Saprospiraceae bacterium]
MKFIFKTLVLAGAMLLSRTGVAQETWSLERCIQYAKDNNITVKQAQANVRTALISERQAKANLLPNVSANANVGQQFGRTIDPTTNQFSTVATTFNSLGLSAGVNVFSGGLINHSIKQASWNLKAATADAEQLVNNLGLQIASAYLSILLGEEQLENAQKRIAQAQEQLNVTQKLIGAGSLPAADQYNIMAQLAQAEQAAVQARNSVELSYLTLKQLLQMEPDFNLIIERPDVPVPADANPEALTLMPVYETATGTQATIRSADYQVKSAQEGIAIAKSAYYPTVSAFANLSSSYSSQLRDFNNPIVGDPVLTDPIILNVNGQDVEVRQYTPSSITYPNVAYFDQIDQNFGQGIGASISIPIYQNGRTRLNVERARLGLLTAQMRQIQTQQQLKNDIQTAIANARAARLTLEAAQKSFDATDIAYQNTTKRHALGTINTLDLTTARNNRDIAENDLVVAKYDYVFKLKILDFYLGKPLTMN